MTQARWNASSIYWKFLAVRVFRERMFSPAICAVHVAPRVDDAFLCAVAVFTWSHGAFVFEHCKNKDEDRRAEEATRKAVGKKNLASSASQGSRGSFNSVSVFFCSVVLFLCSVFRWTSPSQALRSSTVLRPRILRLRCRSSTLCQQLLSDCDVTSVHHLNKSFLSPPHRPNCVGFCPSRDPMLFIGCQLHS